MIASYSVIGDALYDFCKDIDITAIYEDGWAKTFDRPFMPDEVTAGDYPVLMVVPAEDEAATLDSHTDDDRIVYWVRVYDSAQVSLMDGEADIRALADLVRNAIRAERGKAQPFAVTNAVTYDLQISGSWGWDVERSERFYQVTVSTKVAQDFE